METIFFLVASAADYNQGTIRDDFMGYGNLGSVFTDTMIWMFAALLILSLIYYFLINGISNSFNGLFKFNYGWAWLLTLILAGLIGFFISYFQAGTFVYKEVNGVFPPIGQAGQRFITMSTIYSLLLYAFFSLS